MMSSRFEFFETRIYFVREEARSDSNGFTDNLVQQDIVHLRRLDRFSLGPSYVVARSRNDKNPDKKMTRAEE